LDWAWQNDPDIVPYFAIGFFAGLRPISELQTLKFSQISLPERVISVVTTKTIRNPRRQVPIEDNLAKWLTPFIDRNGLACPSNLIKRVNRAKEASGIGWGHDIMRHSYGSYWEAAHRTEAGCRESLSYNMGHSNFKTYEQNYRNDRTVVDTTAYWSITLD
jgi:integrase